MPETCISSLGEEDPLKKEMGTGLSSLCLENSMHRGAWWAISSWGGKRVGHDSATKQQQVVCHVRERKDFPPNNPALTDVLTIVS